MSQELDELFGSTTVQPRTKTVIGLLVGGFLISLGGLACTALPGIALMFVAWSVVETEMDRIESGYFPLDLKPRVQMLRVLVYLGVVFSIVVLAVQLFLLTRGFYTALWATAVELVLSL